MPSKKKARALKKKITPRPLKDAGKLATSKAFTPLGKLSILPRELRDEIYSHVFSEGFLYPHCLVHHGCSRDKRCQIWCGSSLSMLQVSNAIREEFQAILYSKGVFDMGYGLCKQIQRSDIPFVNEILNVTITVILHAMSNLCKSQLDGFWSDEEEAEPPLDPILEPEPVSHFTGTSIMRNACVIELNTRGPTALSALLSSPVVHAISQLIGFKTVRLVFFTMVDYWVETRTPVNIRESINNHGTCLGFDTLVLQVSSALEPALGSFTVTRGRDSNMRWCQDVTFHPQDHSTAKMNKLETVSSSRTEEMTSAYPFLEWTERYGPKWENHQSVSTHFLHKRSPINSPDVGATVVNGSQQF